MFEESYYKTGNYVNYLHNKNKYKNLANEIFILFNSLCINEKDIKILDYGCAVGLLLDELKDKGYNNIFGYDISDWAIKEASKKHKTLNYKEICSNIFDICFVLDVLEHMTDEQVKYLLQNINCNIMVFRIPVSNNGGKTFVLDVSNNDKTHINCKEKIDWHNTFINNGYKKILKLNLKSIYDSEGVYCGIAFK